MSEVKDGLRYSKDHEWVKVEGGNARIGISDHAQHQLTELAFIQLPQMGQKVKAGDVLAIVESVKNTADVYSPVSGEVVEVNSPLEDDPQVINKSPYDNGWIAVVKMSNPSEVNSLMDAAAYKRFLAETKK
ncbi:MAG: glycine cleavage system protein H [Methanomassiliicoccales archaeon PtaU1.Bin124]|nr:MAG: glycine cleavage system protein H [Methanomassiliicoccales archaeon PtaU1.Bin124]